MKRRPQFLAFILCTALPYLNSKPIFDPMKHCPARLLSKSGEGGASYSADGNSGSGATEATFTP